MHHHVAIGLLAIAGACGVSPSTSAAARPAPDTLLKAWTGAFLARDLTAMVACYEPGGDTVLFHSTGDVVRGIEAIRADYAKAFAGTEFVAAVFEPTLVRTQGDVAWTTGRLRMHTRQGKAEFSLEVGTSFVMRWQGDGWRIAMEQSTALAGVPRVRPK